jgi:glutaconate CoA-transferase subunit A
MDSGVMTVTTKPGTSSGARRPHIVEVTDATAAVQDGMTIAIGGFINSGHPMAIVRQLIRDGRKNLTVVGAASAGLEIDLLIAAGVATKIVTPYVGAEGLVGIAPAFRRAAQSGLLETFELDEAHYYAGLRASAQRVPFNPWRAGLGTSLVDVNPALKVFRDPVNGEPLIAVPAIEIDVAFLHAAISDRYGNVQHNGSAYGDVAISAAAEKTFVSVEQIVSSERIRIEPLRTTIDGATGVVRAPFGAHPYAAEGYYRPDEDHLRKYIAAGEEWLRNDSRAGLDEYLEYYITEPADHIEYLVRVGPRTLFGLNEY